MSDIVIVTDSKQGLAPIFGCLNLLSITYCDVKQASLNRYFQTENAPSLLLFRPCVNTAIESVFVNMAAPVAAVPAALLLDTMTSSVEQCALNAGFTGVVPIDMALPQMVKALSVLHAGGLWYSRQTLEQLVFKQLHKRRLQSQSDPLHTLTQKEILIAQLSAEGLANRDIAARLHLSPNTVKTHMQRIFAKVEVKNRTQLGALLNNS